MTVVVAVRTGSAAIIAADSKLTTQAQAGTNPDGTPRILPQTYEYAVKICQDGSGSSIAAFAGYGGIGEQNAVDYFSRLRADLSVDPTVQDARVQEIANGMVEARRGACVRLNIPFENAAYTAVILAAAPDGGTAPRLWQIELEGSGLRITEILRYTGVYVQGNVDALYSLLYGISGDRIKALREHLQISEKNFSDAVFATDTAVAAVRRINFATMPVQDAMDFAVFCAEVQVEMDRFLPGLGSSGGPIDVMTFEMAPVPVIRSFPGKTLRHRRIGLPGATWG